MASGEIREDETAGLTDAEKLQKNKNNNKQTTDKGTKMTFKDGSA